MRPRLFPVVATCVVAALLAGCASTHGIKPSGQLLQADTLHAKRSLADMPLTPAAWPEHDWWKTLGDPQLNALIHEALTNNPGIAIAEARARAAGANALLVNADRKPSVSASGSLSGARLPESLIPAPTGGEFNWIKYAYASFHWGLDLWGGKRAAWEAAVDQAHAAKVDTHAARLLVSVNVARAYARLGYAFKQQSLAHEELQRASHAHKLTAQRVDAGIDSTLQLRRADAEVAVARKEVAAAKHQVDTARVALSVLLGKGPDRGLSIGKPQLLTPADVAAPPDLPTKLLGRRPDLVAARWRVEAASQGIKVAKTKFLPNISLGAMIGVAGLGSTSLFDSSARFVQVAPAIDLPIFDAGRRRANLRNTDAKYDLAVAQYNKTLVKALNQVADHLQGLQSLKAQIAAQQQALEAARRAWKLSEQRYKAGVGSFLEALNVRRQLLQTEQAAAALHARQVDLSIQLVQSLGGGFHTETQAAATAHPRHAQAPHSNKR